MFESSPLMKLQLAQVTLYGYIMQHRFMVSHVHAPTTDVIVRLNTPGFPAPLSDHDLSLDLAMHINKDGSVVAETPTELIYASTNVNSDPEFFDTITHLTLTRLSEQMATSLMENEEFVGLSKEQQDAVVLQNLDKVTMVSEHLLQVRAAAAVPHATPVEEGTSPHELLEVPDPEPVVVEEISTRAPEPTPVEEDSSEAEVAPVDEETQA